MELYGGIVTAFGTRTRNPAWVLEIIEQKDSYEPAERCSDCAALPKPTKSNQRGM